MGMSRKRLPTLTEILDRKSLPPVDLFSFYIYMRDQQRSVDCITCLVSPLTVLDLDLWLDISQHTSLCRLYVRELRRSLLSSTPDLEKAESMSALNPDTYKDNLRVVSTLRGQPPSESPTFEYVDRRSPSPPVNRRPSADVSIGLATNTVGRADLRASAERILYTYLIQGAEREVPLPAHIVRSISTAIEVEGRDDPEVFDEAQEYIFQAMERDAAPGFLAAKALGNLVPSSSVLRLVIGLFALLGSLWTSFSLIFLDIKPKTTRVWLLFPFTVAMYCLLAHHFNLDPILALAGFSESTFMSFIRIREPYGISFTIIFSNQTCAQAFN
ncbi:Protein rax1 [Neolecta irregularis DAH-3]|uniref:Protein rax1 n=1 Tax=Neolecta irregularis (strain DAH-3) TaxID=1198029 RepID=A0A1U7LJ98_NEOID|nr:Protein rax1 [Neolecta irregularis DAH-3]|eukprot:OLL22719.1 Protein rax1 [Neolecta irregularis DAH-3]